MFSLDRPLARIGPWLVLAALVVTAFVAGIQYDAGGGVARLGGDFPSFYSAGEIVIDGQGADLYDASLQRQLQAEHLAEGEFLFFAYPPYTAAAYAPLAALPYGVAFGIHTALGVVALIGALIVIRPLVNGLLDGPARLGVASVAAIAAYPVLRSVLGGQNSTFTLLLVCLVARFVHDENAIGTGVATGLMLYKPQFGLIVLVVLIVTRRWQATGWTIIAGSGLYATGAIVMGGGWIRPWLDAVTAFGIQNLDVNGHLMISAWGWFANLVDNTSVAYITAAGVVVVVAVPVLFAVATSRWHPIPWYALAPMIIVAAPSALYYDATLLVLTAFGMLALSGSAPLAVAAVIATTWLQLAAPQLAWSPLFLFVLIPATGFAVAAFRAPEDRVQKSEV